MTLSDLSIRRPVFAWMLMFGLIFFGLICFFRMGVSQMPDVDFPMVNVAVTLDGAAPQVMETDVVDPIEDAMMSVQGIRNVTSTSRQGVANITVEFDLDRNIDLAMQDVQTKISQAQKLLPKTMDPPVVTKTNPEDQPIIWLTLSADQMPLHELMRYTRDVIKDQFSTVGGVGDIFLGGYVDPNLRVWISAKKLAQYQLTVSDVISAVQNEHNEQPAGRIETAEKELNVRLLGEATDPVSFGKILINQRGGLPNYAPLTISHVGHVEEGLNDIRRLSRFNGRAAVGIGVRKQRGANAVGVAQAVKKRMLQVRSILPQGVNLDVNFDSTTFIEDSIGELNFTLLLSALLTALVCYLFLGSWASTFNVLMAIPTSVIGAFIGLYFMGFTLNTFTLLGLSLAIGIVVDDAIMVLENIVRHAEKGADRVTAARVGAREITFAALAASIAIVAIFLPVAFMKGIIGKFFYQFGVTMTIAVMLSLLEALTLTPMRCAQFLSVKNEGFIAVSMDKIMHRLANIYQKQLQSVLSHRWKVIGLSALVFASSLLLLKPLRKELTPPQDQSVFLVRLLAPVGSSLLNTDSKFKVAENYLSHREDVLRYYTAVGGFGGGEVNSGIMFVTLKPPKQRKLRQEEVMSEIRRDLSKLLPTLKVGAQDLSMRGFTASRGFPIEFTVQGPDWEKLADHATMIMKKMESSGLVTDIDTDYRVGMPEVQIVPDRAKAAARGVSVAAIGQVVNALIGGVVVGQYPKGGHRYDIRVRLEDVERNQPSDVKKLLVRNNRGELIPLSELVRIEEKPTLQLIARRNKERAVSIFANLKAGASQERALSYIQSVAKEVLPPGYHVVMTGSAETFQESGQSLLFALLVGWVVSYMILASQFNSFIHPVTVLLAMPFSITGALIMLFLSGQSINMFSFIGLILLMGIVKKNSILLVDFTNQARESGEPNVLKALVGACPLRLRPILMTSVATVAGAIPPALAIGPGAETRVPMAMAVIGGVIFSTVLTLYVVPCAYSLFSRIERKSAS